MRMSKNTAVGCDFGENGALLPKRKSSENSKFDKTNPIPRNPMLPLLVQRIFQISPSPIGQAARGKALRENTIARRICNGTGCKNDKTNPICYKPLLASLVHGIFESCSPRPLGEGPGVRGILGEGPGVRAYGHMR